LSGSVKRIEDGSVQIQCADERNRRVWIGLTSAILREIGKTWTTPRTELPAGHAPDVRAWHPSDNRR
jgi:hypothetical protein